MIKPRSVQQIPVYVVLQPRTLLLDVAGPLEVLRKTNQEQSRICFDVHYVGPAASVLSSIGINLSAIEPLPRTLPPNAMVALAGNVDEVMGGGRKETATHPRDTTAQSEAIVAWLRSVIQPGHKVVSICSGALLAARAGLLDGYRCTTHHAYCEELATLAPRAQVIDNRLYVEDGDCYTSAGVTAGIDLMLHIVSQLTDPACAAAVARYLVIYLRRTGAYPQLSPWLEGRNHIHPTVHRVQDAISADPAKPWPLSKLARVVGSSTRHLSRLFHQHTGMSITDYKNALRVALARRSLSQTKFGMERIAEDAGFASTRQLRRAWRAFYRTSPRETRKET